MELVDELIQRVEKEAKSKGLSMREACRLAGFPSSTVSRWKSKAVTPNLGLLQKLIDAIRAHRVNT